MKNTIQLHPMTELEYRAYLDYAVGEYAREKVAAGNWLVAGAQEKAAKSFASELPQGLGTEDNHLFTMRNEGGEAVGFLWYRIDPLKPDTAFVFDFEVSAPFRRRGYATAALQALDAHARAHGVRHLELHVFGSNVAARYLYSKAGFHETNVQMAKNLKGS
jgi:ribosomal protein S18 acetylase RimI-like enzyme